MATKILLDTHVWLWMNGAVEKLGAEAQELLTAADSDLYLSAASAWEIGIKVALGKLDLPQKPERYLPSRMADNGVLPLPIHHAHALKAASLPMHHRDPFDRMLVAQAQLEGLTLMSADRNVWQYGGQRMWAGTGKPGS